MSGVPILFHAVVFVPTLVSQGATFAAFKSSERYGELYSTGAYLTEILRKNPEWPEGARIVTPRVGLGVTEHQGETRSKGQRHQLVHMVRLHLAVEAEDAPARPAWRPWVLKSIGPFLEDEAKSELTAPNGA